MENIDPTFNCNGKVNINDWDLNSCGFFMKKDLDIVLNNKEPCSNSVLKIFNYNTTGISILLNLQHYVKCLESRLKQFERHEKLKSFNETSDSDNTKNWYLLRRSACEFVYHLRNYLKCLKSANFALKDINNDAENDFNDLLDTIVKFLNRLKNIPASIFLYVSSPVGNSSKQPEYHTYHIHLDLRWLLTTLLFIKSDQWESSNEISDDLKKCIYSITEDLIYISMHIFKSIPIVELPKKTPYACTCMRELWLMLQILTDELNKKNLSKIFWDYVNLVLNYLFLNESMEEVPVIKKYGNFSDCKNPELFCIWLMHHLTLLYGYDTTGLYLHKPSNRYQEIQMMSSKIEVDKILKAYVIKGGKDGERDEIDEELCIMIPLLRVLCIEWGQSDFQVFAFLWDCFHKRLDKPFLLQNRGPWLTSSEKKTPMDILNSVRDRLKNNETSQESSFGLFLHLLGIFLKKNYSRTESKAFIQIKGRIFMKITKKKLEESTECGLYNFISLILTLAITADLSSSAVHMLQVCPDVHKWDSAEAARKCCLIWKSQLTILLLYNEQNLPLNEIADYFKNAANNICCLNDEFSRSMMVWYIDVLRIILTQNNNFECNEHLLLEGWLERCLTEIPPNKVGIFTSTVLKVFQKCTENRNNTGNILMRNALVQFSASRIRPMVNINDLNNNFYEIPTRFGAALTVEACRDNATLKNLGHSAVKLFLHYTTSPILKDMRVTKLYLNLILQNEFAVEYLRKEKEIKDFDLLCIQLWVKTSILTKEDNEQYLFFKNYIANIPTIKEIMSAERDYNEFLQSSDPFTSFLLTVSKKRNTFQSEQEQMTFDNKCKSFLFGIEKWSLQLINDGNKDSKLSIWTYQCIGSIIKHWAPILYSKSSSNMLKTLITKIALPLDQQNLSYRTHLSQKIFSMIILGFENLNVNSDVSLQNLIRELFERFLPFLVTSTGYNEHPLKIADTLSKCFFAKPDFTKSILFILAQNLITIPMDKTTHAVCYLVMYLLINLIKAGKTYSLEILGSVILECVPNILNCYCRVKDTHPHKKHTMDLLREITTSPYYRESAPIREKLKDVIWNVLKKSTIPQPKASFDLLNFTYNINKELFKHLYIYMETFVQVCEKSQNSHAGTLRCLLNNVKKT